MQSIIKNNANKILTKTPKYLHSLKNTQKILREAIYLGKTLEKYSLYPGSPHSSYSWTVSGREGSNMDVKISKNGTYNNDTNMPN